MKHEKKRLAAATGAVLLLAAGSASAIPWTKTFVITAIATGNPATENTPPNEMGGPGMLWIYAPEGNLKNQTTTVTLGDLGGPAGAKYVLTEMVISGEAQSSTTVAPMDGDQPIIDISGNILMNGDLNNVATFQPFSGVSAAGFTCFDAGIDIGIQYWEAFFGDPNNPDADDGTWTGFCASDGTGAGYAGGTTTPPPYLGGKYPLVSELASASVSDTTEFQISLYDAFLNGSGAASEDPQAKLSNMKVTFNGEYSTDPNVPAPATLALLGLGLAGLGSTRRRKSS